MRTAFIASLIFNISIASAQSVLSTDYSIHQEYASTRALGMGNAFTAVADDFSAIFYNPSMLAFRTRGQLHLFARVGASPNALKLLSDINKIKKEPSANQPQDYANLIEKNYGQDYYYRIPTIGAAYVRPNWGIAIIPVDLSLDASLHRQAGPTINASLYEDTTVAFSYAHELHWLSKESKLSWGITAKALYRIYAGRALGAGDLLGGSSPLSAKGVASEGLTGDVDFATSWKPAVAQSGFFSFLKYAEPTFAVVGRNLVDGGFKKNLHLIKDSAQTPPPKLQRRVDFGTKWDLPKLWVFDPHFSFDIRDVGYTGWTFNKGYHAGAELYWTMYNWWKGHWSVGINQGYWTAGFGARLAIFQVDIATYGEEVGTVSALQESRRYLVEASLDF